ncbi:MAG: FMN-binding glutamate synthase family protein [Pseudomonadales bacterium]
MSTRVYIILTGFTFMVAGLSVSWHWVAWTFVILVPVWIVTLTDSIQQEHSLRRNYPLIGRGRWLMEILRPFVRQYFIESDLDGAPVNRMFRSIVYQRAKGDIDTTPYGTRIDTYQDGYEWLGHSLAAVNVEESDSYSRVMVGGPACRKPYSASILNISALSYGALSSAAITALNRGAKAGGFYQNTGEGGLSSYHLEPGGDLVWQIGTGYFGCRTADGRFDEALFSDKSQLPNVKMIELKLSQGAKPGHGGILPGRKNTPEIAAIRHVSAGIDVISPSMHPEFSTPIELMEFVGKLRQASGYKPVGFKLCIGRRSEFIGVCKAMMATGIQPDFITVDGGEGGTGAAPLEYSNSIGMPLREGLAFVDDCLRGFGLREQITVIAAGKIFTGFHMAKNLALGADICNSGRGMMLALGCVQSLVCHTNRCPTGVATQDPRLVKGLAIEDKYQRVQRFHSETVRAFSDLMSSTGIRSIAELNRTQIFRRTSQHEILRYDQIFPMIESGAFLSAPYPAQYAELIELSSAESFL